MVRKYKRTKRSVTKRRWNLIKPECFSETINTDTEVILVPTKSGETSGNKSFYNEYYELISLLNIAPQL